LKTIHQKGAAMQNFIYIEPSEEGIDSLTKQIASGVRKIPAELRGPLKGISMGHHLQGKEEQAKGLFDELIQVDLPAETEFNTESISNVLKDLVSENGPAV
jgi:hypothetical protein